MQKGRGFFVYFIVLLALCLIIFFLAKTTFFSPIRYTTQQVFAPFSAVSYNLFSKLQNGLYSQKIKTLESENLTLSKKFVDQNKIERDNKALRDQFAVVYPRSEFLIEADIVGAPTFLPGFSIPQSFILDRGENDGVKVGDAVVYKDNFLGKVVGTAKYLSTVQLINNSNLFFVAKTLGTNAQGVVKGGGGEEIILDEVLLSDSLKKDDLVLTKGSVNQEGVGFPPNLIVGKITSIRKNPSDLFQKAEIKSNIDFSRLYKVFILIYP